MFERYRRQINLFRPTCSARSASLHHIDSGKSVSRKSVIRVQKLLFAQIDRRRCTKIRNGTVFTTSLIHWRFQSTYNRRRQLCPHSLRADRKRKRERHGKADCKYQEACNFSHRFLCQGFVCSHNFHLFIYLRTRSRVYSAVILYYTTPLYTYCQHKKNFIVFSPCLINEPRLSYDKIFLSYRANKFFTHFLALRSANFLICQRLAHLFTLEFLCLVSPSRPNKKTYYTV